MNHLNKLTRVQPLKRKNLRKILVVFGYSLRNLILHDQLLKNIENIIFNINFSLFIKGTS
jgi:hypothetical protein